MVDLTYRERLQIAWLLFWRGVGACTCGRALSARYRRNDS